MFKVVCLNVLMTQSGVCLTKRYYHHSSLLPSMLPLNRGF